MSVSQTWTDITGLTLAITPVATSSKILLFATINGMGTAGTTRLITRFMRDTTAISVGAAASNRPLASFGKLYDGGGRSLKSTSGTFLDSPSSTSALTYKIQGYSTESAATVYVNRSQTDSDDASYERTVSSITALEVLA